MPQPSIETTRLILRPFRSSDAPAVQELAGERDIADTTMNIPHPYEDGMAEEWIAGHEPGYNEGTMATFAIVLRDNAQLIGAMGLQIGRSLNKAELGYWVGKPFWNRGYATEAAVAMLDFGFDELGLNRIQAAHLARNPSSGRVMEKAGMVLEGTARQDAIKWGRYEDLVSYGILREDWIRRRQ
ncbi:MAG: GNAT family N-acetyltransferase [Gammaproteobacteria bacterium]|nr:GNAT family N-acetyltransferase [Gammaproteobacteria bacterium]NNF50402.1 GNAT family N-acetyltransferase [Woeseiaceae bacterium]MBT8094405.1 GNAT family N-acetyltransferase [Gammaproteobacteria bacterium]MBT8104744.1 GNAT family N-acetyltransferase [Gammaproteobacteria bacterium]NNK24758.1 GNAT family N-acetyltransferase [Woeseiaceae bacterium]